MSSTSLDTNLLLYAANPDSPHHAAAKRFASAPERFVICELVLVELYMLLRNPAVLARPMTAGAAADFCAALRANPHWQHVDYEPGVSAPLWAWARRTRAGFRRIIDARLALTLRHHGVTAFATANAKDFADFGFDTVWNPLDDRGT